MSNEPKRMMRPCAVSEQSQLVLFAEPLHNMLGCDQILPSIHVNCEASPNRITVLDSKSSVNEIRGYHGDLTPSFSGAPLAARPLQGLVIRQGIDHLVA
jgi:hypothetical protein